MTTALDIIKLALKDVGALGVGQSPLPEDTNDSLATMNQMIGQWNRKRWLVYHLVEKSFVSTGAQTYTVGPAGNFVVAIRPDRIESAFMRIINTTAPNQPDYPLEILQSYEDYSHITLKGLVSFPQYLFYDPIYPTGLLYPWPVMSATIYELHIIIKETLSKFATLQTAFNLPDEYEAALRYNLAVRIAPDYGEDAPPMVVALAKEGRSVLRGANFAIARLRMPHGLTRGSRYNILSDQGR